MSRKLTQSKINRLILIKDNITYELRKQEVNYVSVIVKDSSIDTEPLLIACLYINPQPSEEDINDITKDIAYEDIKSFL